MRPPLTRCCVTADVATQCDAGRLSVTYKFGTNQLMEKKADSGGQINIPYIERISRERMGDKACTYAQSNPQSRRCTADRKAVEWCYQDASDSDQ